MNKLIHKYLLFSFLAFHFALPVFAHDLVEVRLINPRIQIDMRYAQGNNPLGRPIYPFAGCFLVREVAEKLSRVQRDLEKQGYGLKIFDAYRPYSMQPLLWKESDNNVEGYQLVYEAEDEAGHNRGTAVDVTLVCMTGAALAMPSDFEDQTDHASGTCRTLQAHVYHNKHVLEKTMRRHGFIPSPHEWWHFDYSAWCNYPVLDVKFEELVDCHYMPPFHLGNQLIAPQ